MIGHTKLCAFLGAIAVISSTAIGAPDEMGVENTKKGVETSEPLDWFKLGDMRLINNNWGSKELGCGNSEYTSFVRDDGSFGYDFHRYGCGGGGGKPDYPEIEFGVHPFGTAKNLVTTPDYSSTDLLPIQIKNINSMSIDINDYRISLGDGGSWNLNFEMWFTEEHPITGNHDKAYAELMIFFGWNGGRWECNKGGGFDLSGQNYRLCHQDDNWPPNQSPQWRYYQFRTGDGADWKSVDNYTGVLDVKKTIQWLVDNAGFSGDLWVSRLELGTEIDDGTSGTVSWKDLTFEVNGESRGVEFFDPTEIVSSSSEPESSSEAVSSSSETVSSSSSSIEPSSATQSSSESSSDEEVGEESSQAESSEEKQEESSETSALFNNTNTNSGTSLMYRVSPTQSATAIKVKEEGRYSVSLFDALGNVVTQFEAQSESKNILLHSSKETSEGLYIMKAVKIQ
ncbi:MAG: hypothetical protein OCC49_08110 [Fibrobacterales bacterium]